MDKHKAENQCNGNQQRLKGNTTKDPQDDKEDHDEVWYW